MAGQHLPPEQVRPGGGVAGKGVGLLGPGALGVVSKPGPAQNPALSSMDTWQQPVGTAGQLGPAHALPTPCPVA